MAEARRCPHCDNSDPDMMEPRILFAYTMWLCLVCTKEWREIAQKESLRADA